MGSAPRLAVVGAKVLDLATSSAAQERTLLIEHGRIADWLPPGPVPGLETFDATGLWAMPGLIDAGAYPFPLVAPDDRALGHGLAGLVQRALEQCRRWMASGVTTVRSGGATADLDVELRPLLAAMSGQGPRLLASAAPILVAADADDARRLARTRIKVGADVLTVQVDEAATEAALRAVLDEGEHARTPVVIAAPESRRSLCLRAGGCLFAPWRLDGAGPHPESGLVWIVDPDAGTTSISAGTTPAIASWNGAGAEDRSIAVIVAELIEVGWTAARALQAATIGGAEVVGQSNDLGSLAPGRIADILFLEGDPLTVPGALARVRGVMVAGNVANWTERSTGGRR